MNKKRRFIKKVFVLITTAIMFLVFAACGEANKNNAPQENGIIEGNKTSTAELIEDEKGESNTMLNISITVGNSVFSAKLYDNEATKALTAHLPMTVNMPDMNSNEKYYYLSDNLPTNSQPGGNINTGDLMLYGSNCLVLFYKDFSTSYSYTRLGYVEDVSGLTAALGSGSVEVTFAVSD